jgi:superoxide oxidase
MNAEVQLQASTGSANPVASYDRVLKGVHWASLLLVATSYAAAWSSHAVTGTEQAMLLVQLHRSVGVTILALTLFRLTWRWSARIPALPAELPLVQKLAARATEYALYALLLAQPVLGILHTNARGRRVDFFFIGQLPPVVGPDKVLAKQAIAVHEVVAYLLLALIAMHAAAALFHHFVRRDDVLNAMLPSRRR